MENKFELNKEILKKILSEKSMTFTYKEIEELMDSEVEKPEKEMDTELVDMCAEILAKKYCPEVLEEKEEPMYCPWEHEEKAETPAQPQKKRIVPFKRVLLVAAVIAIGFVVALTAGASLIESETSDKIVKFYADHFSIHLRQEETTAVARSADDDMVSQMIINNLDNFLLPEALRSDEYEKTSARLVQDDYKTIFYIDIANVSAETSGHVMITQYKNENHDMTNGAGNVSNMHKYFKQLFIDEIDIIVFGNDKQIYISYVDGSDGYEIMLDCDFETAVSIAETIKEKG